MIVPFTILNGQIETSFFIHFLFTPINAVENIQIDPKILADKII
jgi:hypothetical protein